MTFVCCRYIKVNRKYFIPSHCPPFSSYYVSPSPRPLPPWTMQSSDAMKLSPLLSLLCAVSLAVATTAASPLVFTVLGDWGGQDDDPYTTRAEIGVAGAMGEVAASVSSQFTVALGDNFYHYGVKDVHDPRFKETFEVRRGTLRQPHELVQPLQSAFPPHAPCNCRTCSRHPPCSTGGMP